MPTQYLYVIGAQLEASGGSVPAWLALSGGALPEPSADWPQFQRLARDALRMSREPAFGLLVGDRMRMHTHGILGLAASASGTIGQALELLERFAPARVGLVSVTHERADDVVRVRFVDAIGLGELHAPVVEAVVLSVKHVLDAISRGTCRVETACFDMPRPAYAALARDLFGCPVRYAADFCGFELPASALALPVQSADPETFAILQRELDKLDTDARLSTRVRRLLLEKRFPSLRVTARHLHLTPRTLHRRLVAEGTSYRQLLDDVRHALAVEHVRAGHFTQDEIAFRLGYTDTANFRRAFKRWKRA